MAVKRQNIGLVCGEFIIALPESFVEYKADDVVRLFTDSFHKRYDVECSAALHHNKKMTNYHIHLVFSERKMLEHPEVKTATRNMFYDEQGKHRRTKKEILDEQGNLRAGCSIIPKGEVYESHIFTCSQLLIIFPDQFFRFLICLCKGLNIWISCLFYSLLHIRVDTFFLFL